MSNKAVKKDTYFEDKVLQYYKTEFPKKILDKIVIVSENDRLESDFVDPTGYSIVDMFGYGIYFKSIKRNIAQSICDEMFGINKFIVKKTIKAEVR